MRIRLNTDIAAGIIGVLIAAVFWLPREPMGPLSIGFPRAVIAAMVVLSAILIVKGFIRPSAREIEIEGKPARLLVMIGVLIAWWLGIRYLGYLVSTLVVFLGVTVYLARVQRPVTARDLVRWVPIVLAVVGGFYLVFVFVLNVRPPTGLLI